MKNRKRFTFLAVLYLVLSNYVIADTDNEDKSLREVAEEIKVKYKVNGKTKFDNFHEQYIVLWSMGQPSFREEYGVPKMDRNEIADPQALLKYNSMVKELREKPSKGFIRPKRDEKSQEKFAERAQKVIDEQNTFIRDGYYQYFLSELKKGTNKKKFVDVCVVLNNDLVRLNVTERYVPYSEELAFKRKKFEQLLSEIDSDEYSQEIDYSIGCFARLKLSKVALDHLYNSPLISNMLHPELFIKNPLTIKITR